MIGLRKWRWRELSPYNGFTHEERVRGWQRAMFLIDNGLLPKPTVCCVSGRTDNIVLHSENYYVVAPYALNQSIHLTLHRRFRSPEKWRAIASQYAVTGDEWFARLSLVPVDLAGQLRSVHGPEIAAPFEEVRLHVERDQYHLVCKQHDQDQRAPASCIVREASA